MYSLARICTFVALAASSAMAIALPSLTDWTKLHNDAMINAQTLDDLNAAADAFLSQNITIVVSGVSWTRDKYIQELAVNIPNRISSIEDHIAYAITLGGKGLCFVGTILSWFYIHRFGRRTIWLYGFSTLTTILWTIGFLSLPDQNLPLGWGQSLLCVIWLGVYSMSVGPIVYTLVAEIGSTRLRTQTVVLGRSVYYFGNIIFGGILQPKFMSPGDWNLKGKTVSVVQ